VTTSTIAPGRHLFFVGQGFDPDIPGKKSIKWLKETCLVERGNKL
jgi:hypothetical protein